MHFYPGLTQRAIRRMRTDEVEAFWLAISQIEAQSLLLQTRVAMYPYMKKDQQRATHREWSKAAYPKTHSGEPVTTEELALRIQAALNG